jgi:glycosyltransferase involved in cell wall biosynthesis
MSAVKRPLLILTPGFPEDENDSTCLPFVQQLVRALAEIRGTSGVHVIAFQYPFKKEKYTWHGILVTALGGANRSGLARALIWFKAASVICGLHWRRRAAGLLAFWLTECALVGKYTSKLLRLKYFIWLQGQDARPGNSYVRRVNAKGAELIAISGSQKDEFSRNYGVKPFKVIGNGIDPDAFPSLNTGERKIDILGVGSLILVKNYNLFVKVLHRIKQEYPLLNAELIGDGPERENISQMIKSLDMEKNIKLTGLLSHEQVLGKMNDARIFLHTSTFEGNASVLLEALYSGCKVVSTQVPDEKSLHNFHFAAEEVQLAKIISKLLVDSGLTERVLVETISHSAMAVNDLFAETLNKTA